MGADFVGGAAHRLLPTLVPRAHDCGSEKNILLVGDDEEDDADMVRQPDCMTASRAL